jgi:hypothetical protein
MPLKAISILKALPRRVYGGSYQQPRRFYRTEVYVHEAKMSGGIINTPCVNKKVNMKLPYMELTSTWV